MPVDQAKLAKLQAASRARGKGAPRRKVPSGKKAPPKAAVEGGADKKLGAALKKLGGVQAMTGYDEVNMFREDGKVLHFARPSIALVKDANTHVISGKGVEKDLTELVPGIISQLGPETLASLQQFAQSYQMMQSQSAAMAHPQTQASTEADQVPDVPTTFDIATAPSTTDANQLD